MIQLAVLIFFPLLMAWAAISDLLTMTISNRVSIALVGIFIVMALLAGLPLSAIGFHLACGALVLTITFTMFALGWIGGGDAKLAAATAVWVGFSDVMAYALIAAVFGGILTLFLLQVRRMPLPEILGKQEWIARLHNNETGIPYGIALAAAGLFIYPETKIWLASLTI